MQRNTQLVVLVGVLLVAVLLGRVILQQEKKAPVSNTLPANSTVPVNRVVEKLAKKLTEPTAIQKVDGPVNLWTKDKTNRDVDIPGAQSNVKGAVQILYDTSRLRNLQYGDDLLINVPQNDTSYRLNIKKVVVHPGGIKVVQARQDDDVRLILTLGQKNTFANLATLEGNFELVGNTNTGWLMPAENMDPGLDPSIPDFVVLPQAQRQTQLPKLAPPQRLN